MLDCVGAGRTLVARQDIEQGKETVPLLVAGRPGAGIQWRADQAPGNSVVSGERVGQVASLVDDRFDGRGEMAPGVAFGVRA